MLTDLKWVDIPARLMLSLLFLVSGVGKLTATAGVQGYMKAYGVPVILVYPAAAWEIAAGVLLLAGLWIRPVAFLLAGWCLLTAAIFHTALSDPTQFIMFFKNLTMAGGFLMLCKHGSTYMSIDAYLASRESPGPVLMARR